MGNNFSSVPAAARPGGLQAPGGRGVKNPKPKYNFFVIITKKAPILPTTPAYNALLNISSAAVGRQEEKRERLQSATETAVFFLHDGLKLQPAPSGTAPFFLESTTTF